MSTSVFNVDRLIEDQKKYNARLDNALVQARKAPAAADNLFARYGICLSESKTNQLPKKTAVAGLTFSSAFGSDKLFWRKEQLPDMILTVGFLDGSDREQAIVKETVVEWLQYPDKIGIDFQFVDPSDTQATNSAKVRISFARNNQSFSYVGINCMQIPEGQETMHLGWDVSTDYGRATVLHEFGHALGLFHEHQSPFGAQNKIHWNAEVVIEDCKRSQNWSPAETRAQILNVEPKTKDMVGTVYDPLSIMHYRFPPQWTEEGYNQPANLVLSSLDKTFIRRVYPLSRADDRAPTRTDSRSAADQRFNGSGVDKKQTKKTGGGNKPAAH